MSKNHKPKRNWQPRYLLGDDGKRVFLSTKVKSLAKSFDIKGAPAIAELHETLEATGNIYRIHKHNFDEAPRRGEIRSALEEIGLHAAELIRCLEEMDQTTWQRFWQPDFALQAALISGKSQTTKYGQRVERIDLSPTSWTMIAPTRERIEEHVRLLKSYQENALKNLPGQKGGRPTQEAISIWVVNMRSYWIQTLGRRFTVDRLQGQPVSEAARFCVDALHIMEPDIPPTTVINEMQKLISRKRKRATSKNTPPKKG